MPNSRFGYYWVRMSLEKKLHENHIAQNWNHILLLIRTQEFGTAAEERSKHILYFFIPLLFCWRGWVGLARLCCRYFIVVIVRIDLF